MLLILLNTVQLEIFALVLFLPLSPSLLTGEFKTGLIRMDQIIFFNISVSGRIQLEAKPLTSIEGRKTWGEKNPVYCIYMYAVTRKYI